MSQHKPDPGVEVRVYNNTGRIALVVTLSGCEHYAHEDGFTCRECGEPVELTEWFANQLDYQADRREMRELAVPYGQAQADLEAYRVWLGRHHLLSLYR